MTQATTQTTRPKDQAARTADTPVDRGATTAGETQDMTDGFHLVIDALKLNGIKTIYGVPGIPITDFGRMAQAAGIRVISFRHEQNAGHAAPIRSPASASPCRLPASSTG